MKKFAFLIITLATLLHVQAQNVGIGVENPLYGKLHVANASSGISQAIFGPLGSGGISFSTNNPVMGFNLYTSNYARKFMSNGFGSVLFLETATGSLRYNVSSASGVANESPSTFTSLLTVQANGNVGIGTSTPTDARLQVYDASGNSQFLAAAGSGLPGVSTFTPSNAPTLGFNVKLNSGYKFMGVGYGGLWQFVPSTGRLSYYYSSTKGNADGVVSNVFALAIDSNGRFGIGVSSPKAPLHVTGDVVFGNAAVAPVTGYKVTIDGKMICEELKVQLSSAWPDYVFKNDYQLKSFDDLREFISNNNHLPNIPAAATLEKEGLELGDMQKRMMEKIEELTLYVLELENRLKKVEKDK